MSNKQEIKEPTASTLDKYGLTLEQWYEHIPIRDGVRVCVICELPPRSGRFVVDHKHVPRYPVLPPDVRRKYVRGVICNTCNHYVLTRYGSPLRHRNAAAYLERFEERINGVQG